MEREAVVHPLKPIFSERSGILILGSFPSVRSREAEFYYGNPQNRFWQVLANVFGEPLPRTNEERQTLILRHDLALWDVIASCKIHGSADSAISDVTPNDLTIILNYALTDMWMPEMDGEGLVKAIRASERLKSLPVYVVTADVEMQKRYEEVGFTGILLKPVTVATIGPILEGCEGRR